VFRATGIRLSELARIRYSHGDQQRTDVDLERREITVTGKGSRPRVVKISYDAARAIDRYLRVRARHGQAHRAGMWLGVNNLGAADRQRYLPGHRPAGEAGRGSGVPAPVPAPFHSAIPGWTAAGRKET